MSSQAKDPAEKAIDALHDHKVSVVRLQDELDSLIKIFSHMRQSFESEMLSGLGYKKMGIAPGQLAQADGLTKMMTTLVSCKVRFDKAAKAMADLMSPEEERLACLKYVQSLEPADRRSWLRSLREWMKRRNEPYTDE